MEIDSKRFVFFSTKIKKKNKNKNKKNKKTFDLIKAYLRWIFQGRCLHHILITFFSCIFPRDSAEWKPEKWRCLDLTKTKNYALFFLRAFKIWKSGIKWMGISCFYYKKKKKFKMFSFEYLEKKSQICVQKEY